MYQVAVVEVAIRIVEVGVEAPWARAWVRLEVLWAMVEAQHVVDGERRVEIIRAGEADNSAIVDKLSHSKTIN